jgi:hypothetical protein
MILRYPVYYYVDKRNHALVREWIGDRDNTPIRESIDSRITWLALYGDELLKQPDFLDPIEPRSKREERVIGFYELKSKSKKWRIAVYHDKQTGCFVLLYGFRKNQRKQPKDIERAYSILCEYQSRRGTGKC